MTPTIKPGAVIFTSNHVRLASFYEALTNLTHQSGDSSHTVLASDSFELVLHALYGAEEPAAGHTPPQAREDGYIKLFFAVTSLAQVRERAAQLGGLVYPQAKEWEARGFRACDGLDPDGNVIQWRVAVTHE